MNDDIDNTQERLLRERSLAFFGAITASVSHELNNVISIIDQSAGLLGDLSIGSGEARPIPPEKLERIAGTMQRQTQRGLEIIRRLNRFAHSVDLPTVEFDLGETAAAFGALCTRLADMKKTTLVTSGPERPISVTGSPFLLQQWLFLVFRRMLDSSISGDTIEISCGADSEGPFVRITSPDNDRETAEIHTATEQLLCTCLDGTSQVERNGKRMTVRLTLGQNG